MDRLEISTAPRKHGRRTIYSIYPTE